MKTLRSVAASALVLFTAACSGAPAVGDATDATSALAAAPTAARFEGTWLFDDASAVTIACPGAPTTTSSIANTALVIHATADAQIVSQNSVGCAYTYAVVDDVASLVPGQTCASVPDGRGGHVLEALDADTLTLDASGALVVAASGKLGEGGFCSVVVAGAARKI